MQVLVISRSKIFLKYVLGPHTPNAYLKHAHQTNVENDKAYYEENNNHLWRTI